MAEETSNSDPNVPEPTQTPSKFDKTTFLSSQIKAGAKRLLGHDEDSLTSSSGELSDIFEDAAFNPQKINEISPHEETSLRDKLHRGVHRAAVTVKNPRRAFRSKYARTVAENLSGQSAAHNRKCDAELVDAHDALDALQRAQPRFQKVTDDEDDQLSWPESSEAEVTDDEGYDVHFSDVTSTNADTTRHDVERARARVRRVEAQRDSLRAAWILGRHVRRVRIARPVPNPPRKSDFMRNLPNSPEQRVEWDRYLAQKLLWHTRGFTSHHIDDFDELPFDLKELSLTFERLAMVSAPWQTFLIKLRDVYLWRNRRRTFTFLILYLILWYFQHIMTAAIAWIVIAVLRNKFRPSRIDTIRKRVQRAQDEQAKAEAWGELIQRYGEQNWIEPLLDELGPLIQLELSDLSNLLEMVQSFYRWERPDKSATTLFIFTCCLIISLVADMNFCIKLIWMVVGYTFFGAFPLSEKFPKYRRLFQPVYWIFWDIPNLAELAIMQLQEKAVMRDSAKVEKIRENETSMEAQKSARSAGDVTVAREEDVVESKDSTEILRSIRNNDQVIFRAVHADRRTHGRLRLLRDGFCYYDKEMKKYCSYSRLVEIRKIDVTKANNPDASKMARIVRRIEKSGTSQFLPSGLEFTFISTDPKPQAIHHLRAEQPERQTMQEKLRLTVSEIDRDKIFSLMISWSNLKWQPLFSLNGRQRLSQDSSHPTKRGKGNEDLDEAIKSFVH